MPPDQERYAVLSYLVWSNSLPPHGLLPTRLLCPWARILEWVAMPPFRRSSWPRDQTQVSLTAGGFFISWDTREAHVRTITLQRTLRMHMIVSYLSLLMKDKGKILIHIVVIIMIILKLYIIRIRQRDNFINWITLETKIHSMWESRYNYKSK